MENARLEDRIRQTCRVRHYSLKTEKTYIGWAKRFVLFHRVRSGRWIHPNEMAETEVQAYLDHLAVEKKAAAATHRQALNALIFLYRQVLKIELDQMQLVRPKRQKRIPTVLSQDEAAALISCLSGRFYLMGAIMYGCGLRQAECLKLRVQDIDFGQMQVVVRDGKGGKDRIVPLPETIADDLAEHLRQIRRQHMRDLQNGFGSVELPHALAKKYPNAPKAWIWQYVFPADNISTDPRSGERRRHHVYETTVSRAIRAAARTARICKRVTCHTLRHSYATHLVENGVDIRIVQELMGHAHVNTTMIYIHTARQASRTKSPLDNHRISRLSSTDLQNNGVKKKDLQDLV